MIYQFSSKFSFQDHGERLPFLFIGVIYLSSFVLITAISQIIYSEKYKAAWIYYSSPVSTPGLLINGAFKAITMKFYLPVALVIFPSALIILGVSILPNLLLALFNELFICSLSTYLIINELPFSSPQGNNVKTGNFIKNLMSLLIPVMVAGFHFLIYKINVVVYIFAAMAMLLTWLIQDGIRKKPWARIKGDLDA